MKDDRQLAETARAILKDREKRYALFPSDIFDEYAWNMLLHLFVATIENEVLSEESIISLVRTSKTVGQKWLYFLAKDMQIKRRGSGDDVELTSNSLDKLRNYLNSVMVS